MGRFSGIASVRRGFTRKQRREATIGRWVLVVMVLAATGVGAVGALATAAMQDLGDRSGRSASATRGLGETQKALLVRSAADSDILRAATPGAGPSVLGLADQLVLALRTHVGLARMQFVDAGAPADLLNSFDLTALSLESYVVTAATIPGELVSDPAAAPAHLIDLQAASIVLSTREIDVATRIELFMNQRETEAAASVRSARDRIVVVSLLSVAALLALAFWVDRRIRLSVKAKARAEAAMAVASSQVADQVTRQRFAEELREALDAALDEDAALSVVTRALSALPIEGVGEVLLADSSRAHVQRVAATSDRPGCGVGSPWDCPAVRRGAPLTFESSGALRACSQLYGRPEGALSASCVPLLFNGSGIGVLHVTGPDGEIPTPLTSARLAAVASETANRIGTIRVLAKTQFQAETDGLTGMLNRRSLEDRLRSLIATVKPFTIAFADLDHFKLLNDTYGHEGGDRALRVFSTAVHDMLRGSDIAGRYGGEEFVFAFPERTKLEALSAIERFRMALRVATESGACPPFTSSFGVAEWTSDMTVDVLLQVADERLREAKRLGRDRVVSEPVGELARGELSVTSSAQPVLR
jgi:diguanylate cyclase (GGDEF)-like protein